MSPQDSAAPLLQRESITSAAVQCLGSGLGQVGAWSGLAGSGSGRGLVWAGRVWVRVGPGLGGPGLGQVPGLGGSGLGQVRDHLSMLTQVGLMPLITCTMYHVPCTMWPGGAERSSGQRYASPGKSVSGLDISC